MGIVAGTISSSTPDLSLAETVRRRLPEVMIRTGGINRHEL
jgi:hypothetical protein